MVAADLPHAPSSNRFWTSLVPRWILRLAQGKIAFGGRFVRLYSPVSKQLENEGSEFNTSFNSSPFLQTNLPRRRSDPACETDLASCERCPLIPLPYLLS
jgi:hypothetical protein